jgi:hypothetical protein
VALTPNAKEWNQQLTPPIFAILECSGWNIRTFCTKKELPARKGWQLDTGNWQLLSR